MSDAIQIDAGTRGRGDAEKDSVPASPRLPVPASPPHRVPASSSAWLDLPEAARRCGLSVDHLRRTCRQQWLAKGLARQTGGGGKRSRWQVHETADPSLARAKFPEQMKADLSSVPDAKRREAARRKQILMDWSVAKRGAFALGFDADQATAQFLSHHEAETGRAISRSTLYGWERKYREGGLAGLVDGRGVMPRDGIPGHSIEDPFVEEVRRLYLTPRKLKLSVCVEIAALKAAESAWPMRSYKTCQRYIAALPKALVLKQRFGEEAFVNDAEPYIERDYSGLRSNEIWCADHHLFDVLIAHNGRNVRPWLTAWMDLRSRRIVGWRVFAHDPSSDPILGCFSEAVMGDGIPENVYIDNGKDFDSFALNGRTKKDRWLKRRVRFELDGGRAGVFPSLDIQTIHAWPYHGQSKPIERWFGTIEQWTPCWPTYCGRGVSEKPGDLQLNLERGKAPPLNEFSEWFGGVVAAYNGRPHTGDGMDGRSPDAVFAECLAVKRTTTRAILDVHCLRMTQPVKVTQNGVTYQGLRYGQHQLLTWLGQDVILRVDDKALGSVQVWSLDGKFMSIADANQRLAFNATSEELRAAIRQKKQARKTVAAYFEQRPRLAEDLPDLMLRSRFDAATRGRGDAEKDSVPASPRPPIPASILPVRSSLEDQMPALQRAIEARSGGLRTAVGAEGMSERMSFADLRAALKDASGDDESAIDSDAFPNLRAILKEDGHE